MVTSTSGTVATTIWTVQKVIDHAFRRCRIPTPKITGELLTMAKDMLFIQLSGYTNDFMPLWCVDRILLGLYQNVNQVQLPQGTVDVDNINLQTPSIYSGTDSVSNGGVLRDFGTQQTVFRIGILPSISLTLSVIVETSPDGVNFTQLDIIPITTVAGQWSWFDVTGGLPNRYIRVRDATGQSITSGSLFTAGAPMGSIPCSRLNQDDWANLPNRNAPGQPLLYWAQRLVDPTGADMMLLNLFYPPDFAHTLCQLEIFRHRYIMDVGSFLNTLEIPQRFYDAVVSDLAWRLSIDVPDVPPDWVDRLQNWKEAAMLLARTEERDNSPIRIMPNIRGYTR